MMQLTDVCPLPLQGFLPAKMMEGPNRYDEFDPGYDRLLRKQSSKEDSNYRP